MVVVIVCGGGCIYAVVEAVHGGDGHIYIYIYIYICPSGKMAALRCYDLRSLKSL